MNNVEITFSNDDADIAYIKLNGKFYNDVHFFHLYRKVESENLPFVEIYGNTFTQEEIFDIAKQVKFRS